MKNIFRFFSIMLAASTMMVFASCGDDPADNPDQPTTYTVTVNTNDATLGTVTVSPLQATYEPGTQVTVTATPAANANFISWSNGETNATITITVNENVTLTANFQAKPQSAWSATFNGQTLDVAGYGEGIWADYSAYGVDLWVFGCAKAINGDQVSLPYITCQFETDLQGAIMSVDALDFYEREAYNIGGTQYGDWQPLDFDNINFNCTAVDMTAMSMSAVVSCTMYYLTDLANDQEGTVTPETATHGNFSLTFSNIAFEQVQPGKASKANFGRQLSKRVK